ncbi:ribonuclease H-like domain-containing protein [candidate division NPL-UPA2 bacterium]|nr:ribonuclease H-like domain-containing protein [candidate division NPL-UPA2 bacterium]
MHPTEPPHVYLIGLWDGEKGEFVHFLGRGAEEEQGIFEDFLSYVGNPEGVCLYHWTDFEVGTMKEVAGRHPQIAGQLERLINSCVDLKEVIKRQVYLPVPTYSIKSVAPCLGFHWRQKDVDAFESMALYWEFLKDGEEKKIQKVLDYNEDDCQAMFHVDQRICQEFGLES